MMSATPQPSLRCGVSVMVAIGAPSCPGAAAPKSLTKMKAMIAIVRKISIDIVDPMPRLRPRIRLL